MTLWKEHQLSYLTIELVCWQRTQCTTRYAAEVQVEVDDTQTVGVHMDSDGSIDVVGQTRCCQLEEDGLVIGIECQACCVDNENVWRRAVRDRGRF